MKFRKNSRIRKNLGAPRISLIEHAVGAIQRILPHVEVSWKEISWKGTKCSWGSTSRTEIQIIISPLDRDSGSKSISVSVQRRGVDGVGSAGGKTLDTREFSICQIITSHISEILHGTTPGTHPASLEAIRDTFDEHVVASHVEGHHKLRLSIKSILSALHTLAEQSYENKALTFGCIIDQEKSGGSTTPLFPNDFLNSKKYKALSDGFRTAYIISNDGNVLDFVDLEVYGQPGLTEKHFYPEWAEPIATASRGSKCGIALSRQGDILIFDGGTLRFTYRFGQWQYWNHSYLVTLLKKRAKAQKVNPTTTARVVASIYRAALDVSFRRAGGLFVILHNKNDLRNIIRRGDAIKDKNRSNADLEFDALFRGRQIQSLKRPVAVELASLDGAIILENSGELRAYASVIQPKKKGQLKGTEGSRTKAAIGASMYGVAIKISSDGEIVVYYKGAEFIRI